MKHDEKWPFMVYEGREYQTGPDNGCFYRWSTLQLGVCEGDVDQIDRHGNRFCHLHMRVELEAEAR